MTYNAVKAAEISLGKSLAARAGAGEHPRQQRGARLDPVLRRILACAAAGRPGGHRRVRASRSAVRPPSARRMKSGRSSPSLASARRRSWVSGPPAVPVDGCQGALEHLMNTVSTADLGQGHRRLDARPSPISFKPTADRLFMPWVVVILLGAGLFLTLRYRVRAGHAIPRSAARNGPPPRHRCWARSRPFQGLHDGRSPRTIGTGNIAGVATAIVSGGPGAPLLDLGVWLRGDGDQVQRGDAGTEVSRRAAGRHDRLRGRCTYLRDGLKSPVLAWAVCVRRPASPRSRRQPFTQTNSIAVVVHAQSGAALLADRRGSSRCSRGS